MIENQRIFWSGQYLFPDSEDPGDEPDTGLLEGKVTFSPVWDAGVSGLLSDSQRSTYVKPFPIDIRDGQLMSNDDGTWIPGAKIPAAIGGQPLAWVARFDVSAGGESIKVRELKFTSNPGGEVHLHNVIPAEAIYPQLPPDIVKGDSVTDIYAQGSYVVFIVGDPPRTKQYVIAFPGTAEAVAAMNAIKDQIDIAHNHIHQDVADAADSAREASDSAAEADSSRTAAAVSALNAEGARVGSFEYFIAAGQHADIAGDAATRAMGHAGTATTKADEAVVSALEALGYQNTTRGYRDESEDFAQVLRQRIDTGGQEIAYTSDGKPYLLRDPEIHVPLRVDTTVGTRVFVGETMIYGDTGWRDLTPLLRPEWVLWSSSGEPPSSPNSNSFVRFRREGNRVELSARIGPSSLLVGLPRSNTSLVFDIPAGFRPHRGFIRAGDWWSFDTGITGVLRARNDALESRGGSGNWTARELVLMQAGWTTDDPSPFSLPGIAG